jgi:hypothetical protein
MVLEDMVGCNIVCRSRQERIYVAGVATFSRRCRVHARCVSGVAASCYKAKAAVADLKAKLDVNTKRPQIKERKEKGWIGKKGIDVKADTLQLGQNCARSRARFNIVAEIAFPSKRKKL